jgi:hypothetical protein
MRTISMADRAKSQNYDISTAIFSLHMRSDASANFLALKWIDIGMPHRYSHSHQNLRVLRSLSFNSYRMIDIPNREEFLSFFDSVVDYLLGLAEYESLPDFSRYFKKSNRGLGGHF